MNELTIVKDRITCRQDCNDVLFGVYNGAFRREDKKRLFQSGSRSVNGFNGSAEEATTVAGKFAIFYLSPMMRLRKSCSSWSLNGMAIE